MRHNATAAPDNHWAVGKTTFGATVLVQLQENGEQVRIPLLPQEAERMAAELLRFASLARQSPALPEAVGD